MTEMKKTLFTIILALSVAVAATAQTRTEGGKTRIDGIMELDKTVHDFGDVLTGSGALKCSFTVKNISKDPIAIYNVVSSCGCTDVKWTREPIAPGATGTISASYNNDEGPYPFDKNLTAYFSGTKKPVVLRLRGSAYAKKLPLGEMYPVHLGNLAMKETEIKAGNISQGSQRADAVTVANIGKSAMNLRFENVSPGLEISVSPERIAAGETARINYVVTASRDKWGMNEYKATPVADGKRLGTICFRAFTKEDFSDFTKEQRRDAAQPSFDFSTYNYNVVKAGTKVKASFPFKNNGKSTFKVYKVDSDWPDTEVAPVHDIAAGESGEINVTIDTTNMPVGENVTIVTLTTNTPLRPLINLFIGGAVK